MHAPNGHLDQLEPEKIDFGPAVNAIEAITRTRQHIKLCQELVGLSIAHPCLCRMSSQSQSQPAQAQPTTSIWQPAPEPKTKLGIYRQLAPNAGVHVSPLQSGAMSIGDQWSKMGMGEMDKEMSFKLLDAYYDAGGNFIDTANN